MKVLLLFDIPFTPPANQDYTGYWKSPDWKSELHVLQALKRLGHEVKVFGIYDEIDSLAKELQQNRPDVVFNICESFGNDRDLEPHLASLLELFKIPYTGAGPQALQICKDKSLTKKILSYHGIRVPEFQVSYRSNPLRKLDGFSYPAIIKPLGFEGSEGISKFSLVENEKQCLRRIQFLHERLHTDVIIEEYIPGRDLYVGVFGNDRITILPPREMFFSKFSSDEPKIATFKAKWDENYRKKWGIRNGDARSLSEDVVEEISKVCKQIYQIFQMKGYGRIDLRLTDWDKVVFIEANPNPSISKEDDFAKSAEKIGLGYDQLISKIISLAII